MEHHEQMVQVIRHIRILSYWLERVFAHNTEDHGLRNETEAAIHELRVMMLDLKDLQEQISGEDRL